MKKFLKKGYLVLIFAFLYTPILVLMLYSVNQSRFSLQWHGFSLHWYQILIQDTPLWLTFGHSILLGILAAGFATILGLCTCLHFFLHPQQKTSVFFNGLIFILITLPDLVFGIALLIFFATISMPLGFFSLLIAHITFCLPFVILTLNSRIHTLDRSIYFSAQDLGATRWYAIIHVLLPLLYPTIFSAFLLAFTLSFDDVVISYFVAGPEFTILPLTLYALVKSGVTPELNALCTITVLLSISLVILAYYSVRKKP